MAYATYTTEALVCGSKWSNTSDRSYLLFTREFGVVWATARSVREERSRQRQALQDCALIRVSLVRGKAGWRVGSVESESHPFLAATDRAARGAFVVLVRFVRRFLHGEVSHRSVFDDVIAALQLIHEGGEGLNVDTVSSVFEYRALAALGYVAVTKTEQETLLQPSLPQVCQQITDRQLALVLPRLEEARLASHL